MFDGIGPALIMAVVRQVIQEFQLEFCKPRRDCVKSRLRWIISRGPPRSMPNRGSDDPSTVG
jgi:hypothetical protein